MLEKVRSERADVEYLRVLHLAANPMECEVELALGSFHPPALICSPQSLHTPLVPTGGGEISSGGDQEHGKR